MVLIFAILHGFAWPTDQLKNGSQKEKQSQMLRNFWKEQYKNVIIAEILAIIIFLFSLFDYLSYCSIYLLARHRSFKFFIKFVSLILGLVLLCFLLRRILRLGESLKQMLFLQNFCLKTVVDFYALD